VLLEEATSVEVAQQSSTAEMAHLLVVSKILRRVAVEEALRSTPGGASGAMLAPPFTGTTAAIAAGRR